MEDRLFNVAFDDVKEIDPGNANLFESLDGRITKLKDIYKDFIKNTNDLLFSPDVSAVIGSYGPGGYPPIINAGDVSNKGFEFEFAYATDPKKNLGMNINL